MKKSIIIFGSSGMLGYELVKTLKDEFNLICPTHQELDLSVIDNIETFFYDQIVEQKKNIVAVINCVAITNTKEIQFDFKKRNESFFINALLPKYLSIICSQWKLILIHFSTDYIFSELSDNINYYDEFPLCDYAYHKLIGELFIDKFNKTQSCYIFRVGWIYGIHREKSFIHKFLRTLIHNIKENKTTFVVDDQVSTPTSTQFVSDIVKTECLEKYHYIPSGLYKIVPDGFCSRYDFAKTVLKFLNHDLGINDFNSIDLLRSKTDQNYFPYPLDSRLNFYDKGINFSKNKLTWEEDLRSYLILNKDHFINFIKKVQNEQ